MSPLEVVSWAPFESSYALITNWQAFPIKQGCIWPEKANLDEDQIRIKGQEVLGWKGIYGQCIIWTGRGIACYKIGTLRETD